MSGHPFRDVVIAGVHNARQARVLEGETSFTITIEAALGALADAGLTPSDVNGVVGALSSDIAYELGLGPVWQSASQLGIPAVVEAAGHGFESLPHRQIPQTDEYVGSTVVILRG